MTDQSIFSYKSAGGYKKEEKIRCDKANQFILIFSALFMFGFEAMDFAMQLVSGVLEHPNLRLWNN